MTNEEFIKELALKNPNIEPLSKFEGPYSKITYRCKKHDIVSQTYAHYLLEGAGCKQCGIEKREKISSIRAQKLKEKIEKVNPFVEVLEILPTQPFGKSGKTERVARIKCLLCGEELIMRTRVLLLGSACTKCRGKRISQKYQEKLKTTEEFQDEISQIHPNIKILGEYVGSRTKIKYLCTRCGYEHSATPTNLLTGYGCPRCKSVSRGESRIEAFLKENNIIYEKEKCFDDCRDQLPLRFDFYLPDYNMAIEFQGEQHYQVGYCFGSTKEEAEKGFEILIKHDEIKREYCRKTDKTEVEICYTDIKKCGEIIAKAIEDKKKEVMPE